MGTMGWCWAEDPPAAPTPSPSLKASIEKARGKITEAAWGLQPTFFGDLLTSYNDAGRRLFDWNALELDLAKDLHEDLQVSTAFVQTHDSARMTVGYLDYHPFGGTVSPRGRLWVEKGFHIQAGRFDVSFGNDWQFFASKDSISISRPITTSDIMDGGYNDAGIRLLGNNGTLNFSAFLLSGFSHGDLMGGRLGFTPFGNPFSLKGLREPKTAEFGFSYFLDEDHGGRKAGWGSALDAEIRLDPWSIRGEYVTRTLEANDVQPRATRHGWHVTQEYALGGSWPTLFARYERATVPLVAGPMLAMLSEPSTRVAAGLSSTQWGILQFKLEGQRYIHASIATREAPGYSTTRWFAQIVLVL